MTLYVYRNADPNFGDCTYDGISGKAIKLTLIGDGVPQLFTASEDAPAVELKNHAHHPEYCFLVPLQRKKGSGPMFGGNFAYSSDSRISELVRRLTGNCINQAIPIHDRWEP